MPPVIRILAFAAAIVAAGCSAFIDNDPAKLKHRDAGSDDVLPEPDGPEASDGDPLDVPQELDAPDGVDSVDSTIPDMDVVEDVEIEFTSSVLVDVGDPPATFTMGTPSGSPGHMSDEVEHRVTLTRSFEILVNEVTQGEFEALMGFNPSYFWNIAHASTHPVDQVTWHDAAAYANALSGKDGYSLCYNCDELTELGWHCELADWVPPNTPYSCPGGWRLPTEAEWEYAARAGVTTDTPGGDVAAEYLYACPPDDPPCPLLLDCAWFCGNSEHETHDVRTRDSNDWGLYDMVGNVHEWCFDAYGEYSGDVTDPWGLPSGTLRVIRGGSWLNAGYLLRFGSRDTYLVTGSNMTLGFRLVRNP